MKKQIQLALLLLVCCLGTLFLIVGDLGNAIDHPLWRKFFEVTQLGAVTAYTLIGNLAVFAIVAIAEIIYVGWEQSSLYNLLFGESDSKWNDIWSKILSVFGFYRIFTLIFTFGFFHFVTSVMYKYVDEMNTYQYLQSHYLQFAFVFIFSDFKIYLWHYLMHRRILWEVHKFHHSATEFNIITNERVHFVESAIGTIFDAAFYLILGVPPIFYILAVYIKEVHASLLHSRVNITFGWLGRYLILSPRAHRIHHSVEERHHNKNFGAFFVWWDRLFGTFYESDEEFDIGVENNSFNKRGFWSDMIDGTKRLGKAIIGK